MMKSVWDRCPKAEALVRKMAPQRVGSKAIVETLRKKFPDEKFSVSNLRTFCSNHGVTIIPEAKGRRANTPDLSKATPKEIDAEGKLAGLRGTVSKLAKENSKLLKRNGELQSIRDLVMSAVPPITPAAVAYKPRKKSKKNDHPAFLLLSDWQIGEVIDDAQAGGWGAFDLATAKRKVTMLAEKILDWIEVQRSGYRIDSIEIPFLGDLVSGDIHDELKVTAEFPTPVAACEAGKLAAALLARLAPHFKRVRSHFIGTDNHGRLTKKPQYKQGALNNWNVVVCEIMRARLREHANVELNFEVANPAVVEIEGSHILMAHGHDLKAWMGIPWYSMERYRGRNAIRYAMKGKHIRLAMCGHYHTPAEIPGWATNGCLTGTTELDHAKGRFSCPSQKSFLWNRKYGAFNRTDWDLT
jgi:hypothetical protein